MLISLIRHGEMAGDPFCRPERPVAGCLSENGIAQAQATARALADIHYDLVLSSPYGRALQTAEICFAHRHVPIEVVDQLHEWLPNPAGKQAEATAVPSEAGVYAEQTWKTDAGEGTYDMYARIVPAFLGALSRHGIQPRHGGFVPDAGQEDLHIAVTAHGGTLNILLAFMLRVQPFPIGAFSFALTGVADLWFAQARGIYYPQLRIPARHEFS